MESNPEASIMDEDEEEYVLLDLEGVSDHINIPAGAPYVLSGLDSLNPVLLVGNVKLIGEYQETVGTCLLFSEYEKEASSMAHPETGSSEMNLFKDRCIIEDTKTPLKEVKAVASLQRILKFRLAAEDEMEQRPASV